MTRTPFAQARAPTGHELKLWAALVAKATLLARKPASDPSPLRRAAERAGKARMPIGQQSKDSPLFRLYALATLWWRLAPGVRVERSADLAECADAVREVLEAAAEPPAVRHRADIDD
ncbi:hypothetical protein BH11PSE1_BH11PSE1_10640 [soil metagenome]